MKVSQVKKVRRFNIKGKLCPRYIEPYKIIEKLNPVAYRLDSPIELKHVHNLFHIWQLKKYVLNPNHVIITNPIEAAENLVYEERPMQILYHKIKQL